MHHGRNGRFVVVADEPEPCVYLPNRTMRLPLRLPNPRRLHPDEFDQLLGEGDRRSGPLLYRPTCEGCVACEALRIPVERFAPSRSQRRVWRRNEGSLRVEVGPALVTPRHLELYNRHSIERALTRRTEPATERDYRFFLVETCVDTREVRYLEGDRLVGVSVVDFGRRAASSVYHYFDPDVSERSLGVYSVLKEIALCAERGIDWYYLGLYVSDCRHLRYKADYLPHQRRSQGRWREFSTADDLEGTAVEDDLIPLAKRPAR